jgi:probable blue pigment (indigoidine) exporter
MTAVGAPHAEPLTLTMLRAAPTAVFLLAALPFVRGRLPRDRQVWAWTAWSGILMVTVFLGGFTEAIIHAGPGNAIVLATTAPFWVVLLVRLGGVELAVGMALALAAAVGWAAGTLAVKELLTRRPDVDAAGLTTGQYIVGGLVLLALATAAEGREGADWSSGRLWLAVAFISIVGSGIATLAYFGALRRLTATQVTSWGFLSPVITVLLEIGLGHVPGPIVLVGMAVTVAGVATVTSAPVRDRSLPFDDVAAEAAALSPRPSTEVR